MQQSYRSTSLPAHQTQPVKRISLIQNQQDSFQATKNTIPVDNEYKYLPPIKPIHQELSDPKWQEYKIDGKNIHNRAYTSITFHDDYLYLYGGYQVSLGVMSDFYRMNLTAAQFQWEKIESPGKESPGPRTRHTMCTHPTANKLFLFGGQMQPSLSTNAMYCWDIDGSKWNKRKVNSTYPPEIDNHSACIYQRNNDFFWVVVGGFFGGQIGLHSNCVFMYNFDTNDWVKLFPSAYVEGNSSGNVHAPAPRDGAGLARVKERVFFYGGSNGHERFNDLWAFHLEKKEWNYVQVKNQIIPRVRSGHSLDAFGNKLVLFGGIHDITWELDDMYCFDTDTQEWMVVDDDSSRRKDTQQQASKDSSPTKLTFRKMGRPSSLKKRQQSINRKAKQSLNQSRDNSPSAKLEQSQSDFSFEQTNSKMAMTLAQAHQKTLDEKKKKEQTVKKMNMLRLFEVTDVDRSKFDTHSPTSEAMRNALMVIGNPKSDLKVKAGKLTEFGKVTYSRFLQPLSAMKNSIIGKRPCARDGHSTVIINNVMVVFGGDRHQMSFNDIHAVDLSQMKQQEP